MLCLLFKYYSHMSFTIISEMVLTTLTSHVTLSHVCVINRESVFHSQNHLGIWLGFLVSSLCQDIFLAHYTVDSRIEKNFLKCGFKATHGHWEGERHTKTERGFQINHSGFYGFEKRRSSSLPIPVF